MISVKRLLVFFVSVFFGIHVEALPVDVDSAMSLAEKCVSASPRSLTLVATSGSVHEAVRRNVRAVPASPSYYVFSRGKGKGFVIVAGDDRLPSIIGITEQGDWDEENVPDMLRGYLCQCSDLLTDSTALSAFADETFAARPRREQTIMTDIAPFLTTHWNQNAPYNDLCPHSASGVPAKAGCVGIAGSQFLYYWRRYIPAALQSSTPLYSEKNCLEVKQSMPCGTPLQWDLMCDEYDGTESEVSRSAVATLIYSFGAANRLSYKTSATSGKFERVPYTLSAFFGMNGGVIYERNNYSQSEWTKLIYDELKEHYPVLYGGDNEKKVGHAVVIHGYRASDDMFYFNFGWDKSFDGYYTTSLTNGMNGYYNKQMALIGARPSGLSVSIDGDVNAVVNMSHTYDVTVTNKSGSSFKGVYFFLTSLDNTPNYLKNALVSDTKTTVADGSTHKFSFKVDITSSGVQYIVITDANLNVIGRLEITGVAAPQYVNFNGFSVPDAVGTRTCDGKSFAVINGSFSASLNAKVANHSSAAFNGYVYYDLYASRDEGQSWTKEETSAISGIKVGVGEESDVTFNVYGLKRDVFYEVRLIPEYYSSTMSYVCALLNGVSTVARFILLDPSDIGSIEAAPSDSTSRKGIYTLQGIKVEDVRHAGMYIVNGRKVFVKAEAANSL